MVVGLLKGGFGRLGVDRVVVDHHAARAACAGPARQLVDRGGHGTQLHYAAVDLVAKQFGRRLGGEFGGERLAGHVAASRRADEQCRAGRGGSVVAVTREYEQQSHGHEQYEYAVVALEAAPQGREQFPDAACRYGSGYRRHVGCGRCLTAGGRRGGGACRALAAGGCFGCVFHC